MKIQIGRLLSKSPIEIFKNKSRGIKVNTEKTLEQLEADAIEATKTIEALNIKKAELEEAQQIAKEKAKQLVIYETNTNKLISEIQSYASPITSIILGLSKFDSPWCGVSYWDKNKHGEENKGIIQATEANNSYLKYSNKIGGKNIFLIANPEKSSLNYNYDYTNKILYGSIRLIVEGSGFRDKDKISTLKMDNIKLIIKRFQKIIQNQVDKNNLKINDETKKQKVLTDIAEAIRKQFPEYKSIEVSYAWNNVSGSSYYKDKGYLSSNVNVSIRPTEEDYHGTKRFSNVTLVDGQLTTLITRVTREPITI